MGYESIASGLPPASSDRRKWWLDNDKPARSEVRPPREGMVPNPNRAVNPYRSEMSGEPDWVDVKRPNSTKIPTSHSHGVTGQKPEPPLARRAGRAVVATVWDGAADAKTSVVDNDEGAARNMHDGTKPRPPPPASRSLSRSSSATANTVKKTPPPKPKKPSSLASPPSQSSTFTLASMDSAASEAETDSTSTPQPDPPARKGPSVQPGLGAGTTGKMNSVQRPTPPQRLHSMSQPQLIKETAGPNPTTFPPRLPSRPSTSTSRANNADDGSPAVEPMSSRGTLKKVPPPPTQRRRDPSSSSGRFDPKLPQRNTSMSARPVEDSGAQKPPMPPPPPRRTMTNPRNVDLMNQDDMNAGELKAWQPLQPTT
jgi:hypothetical protein